MTDRLTIVNELAEAGLIDVDQANTLLDNPTQGMELEFGVLNQGVAIDGAGVRSEGTLTVDTQITDTNTMTVDAKVYTFQDSLTNVDGNIQIGATLAETKANLVAAFDLSGVAGVDYAAAMTAHPSVDIAAFIVDDAILTAKIQGIAGDSIVTTETFTAGTNIFDGATLGTVTAGVDPTSITLNAQLIVLLDEMRTLGIIAT